MDLKDKIIKGTIKFILSLFISCVLFHFLYIIFKCMYMYLYVSLGFEEAIFSSLSIITAIIFFFNVNWKEE